MKRCVIPSATEELKFFRILRRKGFTLSKIPQNLELFFGELRSILDFESYGTRFHSIYNVDEAASGEEAVEKSKEKIYNLPS